MPYWKLTPCTESDRHKVCLFLTALRRKVRGCFYICAGNVRLYSLPITVICLLQQKSCPNKRAASKYIVINFYPIVTDQAKTLLAPGASSS